MHGKLLPTHIVWIKLLIRVRIHKSSSLSIYICLWKTNSRQTAEINRYIKGEVDWLDIGEYKKWTAFGVLLLVLGLVSATFALLCGDLTGVSDSRRGRKSQ